MQRARSLIIAALVLSTTFLVVQYASAIEEGTRAPQFRVDGFDGDAVSLSSLRGKVVIVDFWASWCEPCGDAMPALDRMYRRYKDHGLVVVGVSVDERAQNARGFLRQHRVSFPVVHDADHSVAERYGPPTMPSSYVIDRRGVIRHVHAGFRAGDARRLEAQIRELL
jgi:peroxiredoxin